MVNESRRTFEYKDEKSSKFWEVIQTGSTVTVRYGKTGTNGQSQEKLFGGTMEASKHVAKLISEKTGKGYVEVGAALSTSEAATVSSEEIARQKDQPVTKIQPQKASASRIIKPKSPAHDPGATSESLTALLGKDDVTNRLLAKHPRASTDLLEKLSHSSDKLTRQNVAANPNTQPEILVRLGQQFPKEFLSNPALDLLLMVNPDLMEQVPEALLVRLLKQADCPASLLTWAAGHQQAKVQLAVAMNAKAPEQATKKLLVSQHQSVREAVNEPTGVDASDPNEDPQTAFEQAVKDRFKLMPIHELVSAWIAGDIGLAQWPYLPLAFRLQHANDGSPDWRAAMDQLAKTTWTADAILHLLGYDSIGRYIARHPSTPMEVREAVFEQLAKDSDVWRRRITAESHSTPVHLLEVLAKDKDSSVRSGVAANPSAPTSVLEKLANDKDDFVLLGLVRNPSISTDIKWALAQKKEHFVRSSFAENPVTPVDLLEVLAKDKNSEVRISVAKNSSTPASILEVMARDANSDVRRSVLQQHSVSVIVLDALAKDKNSGVRSVVASHSSAPGSILSTLANDDDTDVRRSVAKNQSTPAAVLQALAQDNDLWVRDTVAENPSTPLEGLAVLATDTISMIRKSVAGNVSTPVVILETLIKDEDTDVRRSVAKNLSTTLALLETLSKDVHNEVRRNVSLNPSTPVDVLRALAKDKDKGVRSAIAENCRTPIDVLEKLASDKDANVLLGVAENPSSPLPVLQRLCDTKFDSVREALASQAHRSAQICQALRKDPNEDVRLAVLRNINLEQATLDEFTPGIDWERDALAMLEHPNLGPKSAQIIADKIFTLAPTDSPWYRRELSKASAEVQAAVNGNMVLSYPGKDPNKAVLEKRSLAPVMALCAGPFVEPNRIVKVAGSTDWLVRAAVARNPGTPPNVLKKLSADAHPLVSGLVAFRYAEDAKAISKISVSDADSGLFTLNRVVGEILRRMRATGQEWACAPLLNCKNWSDHANINEFFSWLKRHEIFDEVVDQFIRDLDDAHRNFFWQLVTQFKDGEVRMRLVKNFVVPEETLEKLVLSEFVEVLLVIAGRPDVSNDLKVKAEKAAIRFITKKGSSYRQMIARNHAYLTMAIRDRLAKDKDWWVKREVEQAQNSPYPEWVYQSQGLSRDDEAPSMETRELEQKFEEDLVFLNDVRRQQVSKWLTQLRAVFDREIQIAKSGYVFITGNLTPADVSNAMIWLGYVPASNKVAPTKSARSTDWLTRLGAALHPAASPAILKLLRDDVDPDVAQAVRYRESLLKNE